MTVSPPTHPPRRRLRSSFRSGDGTIRATAFGTFQADLRVAGERRRRCFDSFVAAEQWLAAERRGLPLEPLTSGQYTDAQSALSILPAGVSLCDAAREFVRAHPSTETGERLSEAATAFLRDRSVSVVPRSLASYRQALEAMGRALGDVIVSSIEPEDLEPVVAASSGSTRNTRIARIGAFFSWCVRTGRIATNPTLRLSRARKVETAIRVLAPAEAERVLRAAERIAPACVPYLAVGMFAGIRPTELRRLTPACFGARYIRLDGSVTKTARARTVAIRPNLAAWLKAYPWRRPPIRVKTILPQEICPAAKVEWSPDVMRHSFATYAYEKSGSAAEVAAEMGHRGTDVFFKHYRALAEPGDGKRYFGIVPG